MSDQPKSEAAAETPAQVNGHLLVYGKLIRGHQPDGPIRPGTEHRITSMTAGFPQWLQSHCTPKSFFRLWGGMTAVDAGLFDGGAFAYRPLRTRREGKVKYFGLFARIQARSEDGRGQPGRRYTHCVAPVVEDDWRPETIVLAAHLLFERWPDDRCFGDPNTERQSDRMELPLPILDPASCSDLPETLPWHAKAVAEGEDYAAEHICQSRLAELSPTECAWAVGAYLHDQDLSREGRWLSFGLGVRVGATGLNDGFALIGDDRQGDTINTVRVRFSDSQPYDDVPDLYDAEFDWKRLDRQGLATAPQCARPRANPCAHETPDHRSE